MQPSIASAPSNASVDNIQIVCDDGVFKDTRKLWIEGGKAFKTVLEDFQALSECAPSELKLSIPLKIAILVSQFFHGKFSSPLKDDEIEALLKVADCYEIAKLDKYNICKMNCKSKINELKKKYPLFAKGINWEDNNIISLTLHDYHSCFSDDSEDYVSNSSDEEDPCSRGHNFIDYPEKCSFLDERSYPEFFRFLKNNEPINRLSISGFSLENENFLKLSKYLPKCTVLYSFAFHHLQLFSTVHNEKIPPHQLKYFFNQVIKIPKLKYLGLNNSGFGEGGMRDAELVQEVLPKLNRLELTGLSFEWNEQEKVMALSSILIAASKIAGFKDIYFGYLDNHTHSAVYLSVIGPSTPLMTVNRKQFLRIHFENDCLTIKR